MANRVVGVAFAGVPLVAVLVITGVAYYAGCVFGSKQPNGKYVTVEESALILKAVMSHQGATKEELDASVTKPVIAFVKKYTDDGYVVVDTGKDEFGNMTVVGVPEGTKDITGELQASLDQNIKEQQK